MAIGDRKGCAIGECNVFGCNCDGGCVPGHPQNAIDAFQRKYPDQLKELGFSRSKSYSLIDIFG